MDTSNSQKRWAGRWEEWDIEEEVVQCRQAEFPSTGATHGAARYCEK